ncbi:hypothetical protein NBH15_26455 [Parabacteroides sp. W1-Q-101]|uniref:hypothetical protein n=1 Tax=Parabacteroides TaxID=375288 RepID=UPI00202E1535|nr:MULTISPECIES: hypothetical protein [Parabacteroides]MCM0721795.1 hypothetical protein [Parabacteroides sp. W1-Q-101]
MENETKKLRLRLCQIEQSIRQLERMKKVMELSDEAIDAKLNKLLDLYSEYLKKLDELEK